MRSMSISRGFTDSELPAVRILSLEISTSSSRMATFGRPRLGDKPRITTRVSWGENPLSKITPAVWRAMSSRLSMPWTAMSCSLNVAMLIGTSWRDSSRFRATTMISSSSCANSGATRVAAHTPAISALKRELRIWIIIYRSQAPIGFRRNSATSPLMGASI